MHKVGVQEQVKWESDSKRFAMACFFLMDEWLIPRLFCWGFFLENISSCRADYSL